MVQVHTVFEASAWRNKVDGLRQGRLHPARASAVAEGRRIAVELHATHVVHDVDGTITEQHRYGSSSSRRWLDSMQYTA